MGVTLLRRLDPWAPPLALMAVIFFLSAQPGLDSGLGTVDTVGRKVGHFLAYALLCLLWWRLLRTRMTGSRAVLTAFLLSSAYGATDELHQSFVEGRGASVLDWAIDTAGAAVVALRLRPRGRARV